MDQNELHDELYDEAAVAHRDTQKAEPPAGRRADSANDEADRLRRDMQSLMEVFCPPVAGAGREPTDAAPLAEFEKKRLLATADILDSDEYDGRQTAALIRRAVAALSRAAAEPTDAERTLEQLRAKMTHALTSQVCDNGEGCPNCANMVTLFEQAVREAALSRAAEVEAARRDIVAEAIGGCMVHLAVMGGGKVPDDWCQQAADAVLAALSRAVAGGPEQQKGIDNSPQNG